MFGKKTRKNIVIDSTKKLASTSQQKISHAGTYFGFF